MRFIVAGLAWTFLALPLGDVASAQQSGRVYRVGYLFMGHAGLVQPPFEEWQGSGATFRNTLREAGFVAGKNLIVDVRHSHGSVDRLSLEATSLVASNVDLIVTSGTAPTVAVAQATKSLPIVFNGVGDPVGKGLVASLARPGGNITGMAATVVGQKSWQLLRDAASAVSLGAALGDKANLSRLGPDFLEKAQSNLAKSANAAGLQYVDMHVDTLEEIETGFAKIAKSGNAGVVIFTSETLFNWRAPIVEMAIRHRLPTVCTQWGLWGSAGCLITYAEDFHAMNRGAATQAAKVLRGTKPADIAVEQPMAFRLIINSKTAKALDLTLSPTLMASADEVIE